MIDCRRWCGVCRGGGPRGILVFVLLAVLAGPGCPQDDPGAIPAPALTPSPTLTVPAVLDTISGLTWEAVETNLPGYAKYALEFSQPSDHDDPDQPWFDQRLVLFHRAFDAPMVLHTTGYYLFDDDRLCEPAALLEANQISVEHRFFEPSRPDVQTWETLTIEQAASDFHRIVEAFRPYYTGRWIGTGTSKGGMAAVFHRRFHPDDVYATVAYVAPICFGERDPRFVDFLAQVGPDDCRQRLVDLQRRALENRETLHGYVEALAATYDLTYDILGIDMAVEHAVVDLPFGFWQYHDETLCGAIPGEAASAFEIAEFVDYVSRFYDYSDDMVYDYEPYFYQAATQTGGPELPEDPIADLLEYPGTDVAATYVTVERPGSFDSGAMEDIDAWTRTAGRRLMYLYGENDPWSAGAFEVGTAEDSYRFFVPGGNHGAVIMDLEASDRDAAIGVLERWGGLAAGTVTLERAPARTLRLDFPRRVPRL